VQNTNENVRICISGNPVNIAAFVASLKEEAPPASMIDEVFIQEIKAENFTEFTILHSHDMSDDITEISPDIAVCSECMQDIEQDGNRLNYAFVNCTNCGPRFTIISDLPYDRGKTTMRSFSMCPECRKEYETITDRRFHAQPTACKLCGPRYELLNRGKLISDDASVIVNQVAAIMESGGVVLIKGLGGMHLACNAFSDAAVKKLRAVKKRDGKPFAVMFRDLERLKKYAEVNLMEELSLESWRRPIVLLKTKHADYDESTPVDTIQPQDSVPVELPGMAKKINEGLNLLGVMLPYMPFHYLLFKQLHTPAIVLTSGNFSSEPILIDNQEAISGFSHHVDFMIMHNRDIYNRTDDSVVRVIAGKERVFRRSRGYVPAPVRTSLNTDGILAFGAELTNCFCIGKGRKAFLSQHIGDLQGLETILFYEQSIAQFLKLFRVKPTLLAVDMHPDYISTKTAYHFAGLPMVAIQHHHAHITSCMAEHHLDEKVIGVAFDGTGYGDDGNTWGSEFFVCDLKDYTRITHFEYIPMPGGDLAAEEPWRMAVSWLYKIFGKELINQDLALLMELDPGKVDILIRMIDRNINCPLTCGAGRLFDAVASLLGLCQVATFQAEGPMRLESLVQENCRESYEFEMADTIRFGATIRGIIDDLKRGNSISFIASKFHNTIISVIFESANAIRGKEGLNKVVLSGGVFQNKYLLEGTITLLKQHHFEVYSHTVIPANDGGIALGQLAVASKRRSLSCV